MRRLHVQSLEFNVVEHCNLACDGCDHGAPELPTTLASRPQFARDVALLAAAVRADEFKLVGGEPLLHPDWAGFARDLRQSGVARRTMLVTNGTLLHRAATDDLCCVDTVRVSRYPGVHIKADLVELSARLRERDVALEVRDVATFRRTLLAWPRPDHVTTTSIYRRCALAHRWSCYTLRDGRFFKCPPAALLEARMHARGSALENGEVDGVPLLSDDLPAALASYLRSREPLEACRSCLGTSGPSFPHRQLGARERGAAGAPMA